MTDQDNLRDRIADTVESAEIQWDTDFNAWQLGRPNSADPGPQPRRIAQAIIDELGADEAIERVAVELAERHDKVPFDQMPEFIQNAWREDARACVSALLGEH